MRNGSVTPREEGFAKQTQVMLLGGGYAEDVSQEPGSGRRSQEPWFRRYSWKKGPQIYILLKVAISWGACKMHAPFIWGTFSIHTTAVVQFLIRVNPCVNRHCMLHHGHCCVIRPVLCSWRWHAAANWDEKWEIEMTWEYLVSILLSYSSRIL
jgi:hypothetical protein